MNDNHISDERTDIDKLISFLRFVNSDYINIKEVRKDLKRIKKEYQNKEDN